MEEGSFISPPKRETLCAKCNNHREVFGFFLPPVPDIGRPDPAAPSNRSPLPFPLTLTSLNPQPHFIFSAHGHTRVRRENRLDPISSAGVTFLRSELDKCQLCYLQLMALSRRNYYPDS